MTVPDWLEEHCAVGQGGSAPVPVIKVESRLNEGLISLVNQG